MEIGRQIKKYRLERKMSQEELADKVYVTRQTVSNWENDKNYPDINSLVLLSSLFGVSLDVLVKGDLKEMEEMIKKEDIKKLNRNAWIYTILLAVTIVSIIPLFFLSVACGDRDLALYLRGDYVFRAQDRETKKEYDIGTYKEIKMFMEGKRLDEIEKIREEGKRPYQTWAFALLFALIAFAVVVGIFLVFDHLGMI